MWTVPVAVFRTATAVTQWFLDNFDGAAPTLTFDDTFTGGGTPSTFVNDAFSGSGALDSSIWSNTGASLFASDNTALTQSAGSCICSSGGYGETWATNAAPSADASLTAVIQALASDGEITLGLRFIQVSTWLAGYYVIIDNAPGGIALTMTKATLTGGGSSIGTVGGVVVTTGFPCTVKFQTVGSTVSVYVNGVLADSGTDTELTAAGRPYFFMNNTTSTHAKLDSIVCTTVVDSSLASHTSDSGHAWSAYSGSTVDDLSLSGGNLILASGGTDKALSSYTHSDSIEVTATFVVTNGGTTGGTSLRILCFEDLSVTVHLEY
jgi:hypothetical protein